MFRTTSKPMCTVDTLLPWSFKAKQSHDNMNIAANNSSPYKYLSDKVYQINFCHRSPRQHCNNQIGVAPRAQGIENNWINKNNCYSLPTSFDGFSSDLLIISQLAHITAKITKTFRDEIIIKMQCFFVHLLNI